MGKFETVNVLMPDGGTYCISRSTSTENRPHTQKFLGSSVAKTSFDGRTCWYPEDAETILHIRMSDTTDTGIVNVIGQPEEWSVMLRDDSLWTYTVNRGPEYEYHQDVMRRFPWAKIGGTYQ